MSNYETILVDKKDWIGTITMNRPDRLNAMTSTMLLELAWAFHQVEADREIRVVILTGAGDAFSSGADIRDSAQALEKREEGALARNERLDAIPALVEAMLMVSKPIIASISGVAVGGGMTISLHCDIRIASEKARFGAVFARIGLIPEFGSTYMLSRIVGIAKACELVFTARIIDAAEAKEIGLVNKLVPADELKQATKEMASAIAKLPPFVIQMAKRGLYQGLDTDIRTQMQFEAMGLDACLRSADHAEAVRAFLEKREPKFEAL
jgi:2-(1,2-epoxy-1,2-dihydrophenyl)acetyl-CoA isomerase